MFDPVDQNNLHGLGLWKPYFFQRLNIQVMSNSNSQFSANP
jgi:hypothetical protein